eukprot:7984480-Prorocentrum_lima.AAC.1
MQPVSIALQLTWHLANGMFNAFFSMRRPVATLALFSVGASVGGGSGEVGKRRGAALGRGGAGWEKG